MPATDNPFIAGTITLGVATLIMVTVSYVSSGTPTQALRTSSMAAEQSDWPDLPERYIVIFSGCFETATAVRSARRVVQ